MNPWSNMPALRGSDGARVEEVLGRGWLVMAAQRGDPEPDTEIRRRAAVFDRRDTAAFGSWLPAAWIEHDAAMSGLNAERRAELLRIAERAFELARRCGRGGGDPEERCRQQLRQEENCAAPSALPHRGLLAEVAACGDDAVAPFLDGYLVTGDGERPDQYRALRRLVAAVGGRA